MVPRTLLFPDPMNHDECTPNGRLCRRSSSLSEAHSSNLFAYSSESFEDGLEINDIPILSSLRGKASGGRYQNGHAKGMVGSFERSNSVDEDQSDGNPRRECSGSNSGISGGSSIYEIADSAHATLKPRPLTNHQSNQSKNFSLILTCHWCRLSWNKALVLGTKPPKKQRGGTTGVHA